MSGGNQEPHLTNDTSPDSGQRRGFFHSRIWRAATWLGLAVLMCYNIAELLKTTGVRNLASDRTMFSIPEEMSARYQSCDYQYLFFCPRTKSASVPPACANLTGLARSECILTDDGQAAGALREVPWFVASVKMVLAAVVTVPRLPDATIHMVRDRWTRGPLAFSLGLVFVAVYITMMVVALRSKGPAQMWMFAFVVVAGPYLISGIFWLFQYALVGASLRAERFTAALAAGVGLPTCLAICINHDAGSLVKMAKGLH
jgi:hypothetical protein